MIYLHSGRPGSGKTLSAVERAIEWKSQGRRVYELGVNGLDHAATGIEPFPGTFEQWADLLQPGDCLVVDEVQRQLPKGLTRMSVPAWCEALTRNRHQGIDMLWTTQDPRNVDAFPRRLVNEHRHYVNKWGRDEAVVYTWPDGVDEPDSQSEKNRADKSKWKYPKQLFALYTSAQVHTRKPSTPRMLKVLRVSMVVAIVCLLAAVFVLWRWFSKAPEPHPVKSEAPVSAFPSLPSLMDEKGRSRHVLTDEEYFARLNPRLPGFLWTAPLYDDRKPVSEPETYCMAVEDGRCGCISEQGTKISMPVEQCRSIAVNGVYNPYRRPQREFGSQRETPEGSAVHGSEGVHVAPAVVNMPSRAKGEFVGQAGGFRR